MFSFSRRRTPGWDKDVIQGTLQRTGPRRAQWPGPQQCLPPCSADQPLGFGSRSKEPQHRRRSRLPGLTESLTLPLRRSTTMCDFLLLFVGCKAPAATCASAPPALNVKRLRIRSIESQRTRGRCPAILASEKCFRKADARSATGKDSGGDGNREIYLSVPSATLSDSQGEEDDTFLESISSPLPRPLFGHDLHGDTR